MKRIYLCGPTVYSDIHIGNLRPILTFDIFLRALRYLNKDYIFVHNITDIDDKIIEKAFKDKVSEREISEKFFKQYKEILDELNIEKPNKLPKVTTNIEKIIKFIAKLIKNNSAYVADGNVYFDVLKFKDYGKLSNQKLDESRYFKTDNKKNPADFALWKKTSKGKTFDSPWGKGRPGWHTECATLVNEYFNGQTIDIHGGGTDLLFPHHENELAQYKKATNKDITREWKHVGHVNWANKKMSKSTGNIITGKEFINKNGGDLLRFIYFVSSVTSPIDLDESKILDYKRIFDKWENAYMHARITHKKTSVSAFAKKLETWEFNDAQTMLAHTIKAFNSKKDIKSASQLVEMMRLIGFNFTDKEIKPKDKKLYKDWQKLVKDKNFKQADKLRNKLLKLRII